MDLFKRNGKFIIGDTTVIVDKKDRKITVIHKGKIGDTRDFIWETINWVCGNDAVEFMKDNHKNVIESGGVDTELYTLEIYM